MDRNRPAVFAAPEFPDEETTMLARTAEPRRPQSVTSFQSPAKGLGTRRICDRSVERGCAQRHALSACLRRRCGKRAHSSGQCGQTQRAHCDHRSDATSRASRRDIGAWPRRRPVPCVWPARGPARHDRVCRQLLCTGKFGGRGSGDQSRIFETSADNHHRPARRATRTGPGRQFGSFSAWDAGVCDLACRCKRRAAHSSRALFHGRGADRAACVRAGVGS